MPVILQTGAAELLDAPQVDVLLSKDEHPSVLLNAIAALLKNPTLSAQATSA